jgi:excisionase family DNA binding protein
MEKLLHTRNEAAHLLSVSLRQIDYLVGNGILPSRRVGRRRLIPRSALEQFARRDHESPRSAPSEEPKE